MGDFLKELKRRNVFRVGVAYVIVSWLIVQVIETVSDPLGLPEWTEAFFIVLVLAGLPLVLIFAWAFELTPEGLKKTKEVDKDESVTSDTGRKLNYAIIGVLVAALGYSFWERQGMVERIETIATTEEGVQEVVRTSAASIAVLPFVNMSADPEQEYFSDGISEELLNLLAKIPDLRVPARTSSFQFKGQNLDIADVAKQLNVKHVLEGSVRKADVRVRVTAQLIEADTGYHLWSETYDRELDDIFQIQDEISAAIVEALSETLGIKANAVPHVKAAANPEAYNAFLLGQYLIKKRTKGDIEAAIPNYEKAIELDPDYAPAYAGLGLAWRLLLADQQSYGTLTLEEMRAKSLPQLQRALELDPNLPEALGAMGLAMGAEEKYEQAIAQGKFEEDPTDPGNIVALAWAYWQIGNSEQAIKNVRRYLDTLEDSRRSIDGANWMLIFDAWRSGDEDTLRRYLDPMEEDSDRAMASGVDNTGIHYGKALMLFMRGNMQTSLDHLDVAFSRGVIGAAVLDRTYSRLGMNDMPPFVERRRAYEEYLRGERQKFLAVACGADGFSTWQPSPEICSDAEAI